MRKRLPLSHDADRSWHVDLPTYSMIPGTCLPITLGLIDKNGILALADTAAALALNPSVECDIPDDTPMTDPATIDAAKMRERYREHPRFKRPDWTPPKIL